MKKNKTADVKGMVLCSLFAALIAAGAFLKVPVPYVPFTLQFLFTNLAGLLLGKRKGLISVLLYIFIGLIGIPVFTQGGGPSYIFQPSFGYLAGFAAGTYLAGLVSERGAGGIKTYILAGLADFAAVFAFGLAHLYIIMNFYLGKPVGVWQTLLIGFITFAPGDILIVVVSAFMAKRLRPFINKQKTKARFIA